MTKMETIIKYLENVNLGAEYGENPTFIISYVFTKSNNVVNDLFLLLPQGVYLTTNPEKKKYKDAVVYYYKDYKGEKK